MTFQGATQTAHKLFRKSRPLDCRVPAAQHADQPMKSNDIGLRNCWQYAGKGITELAELAESLLSGFTYHICCVAP